MNKTLEKIRFNCEFPRTVPRYTRFYDEKEAAKITETGKEQLRVLLALPPPPRARR